MNKKPIVYVDLDGVVADFDKAFPAVAESVWVEGQEKKVPEGFFANLEVMEGAVEALYELSVYYDVHFLSTPQWHNPSCWSEKRLWVEAVYGELMYKKLTLTHHKGLLKGEFLIDDNTHEGFEGEHIHFGTEEFPNWKVVTNYLIRKRIDKFVKKSLDGLKDQFDETL